MKLPVMIGALLCAGALAAYEDLGPLAEARKQYPGIFEAGSVSTLTVKGTPCYVFQGEAEQLFSGEFAEAAGELYEEATLTAKSNFYKHFTRPGESLSITMSGCSVLYQFNNKKIYTVILFVPKQNVTIERKKLPPPPEPIKEPERVPAPEVKPEPAGQPVQKSTEESAPEVKPEPAGQPVSEPAKAPENESKPDSEGKPAAVEQTPLERRIAKFTKRLEKDPHDLIALIALGDILRKSERDGEAIPYYRRAVAEFGNNTYFDPREKIRVLFDLAAIAEENGRYGLALKCYRLSLRQPGSSDQKQLATSSINRLRLKMLR